MKKYTLFTFFVVAALASVLTFATFKTANGSKNAVAPYIMVEIYEIPSYKDKGVHIHWGNRTEVIPFKEFKAEHHDDNGEIITSAINKIGSQGYEIVSTTGGLIEGGMITKIFMQKKE